MASFSFLEAAYAPAFISLDLNVTVFVTSFFANFILMLHTTYRITVLTNAYHF
jgi:hypothetical protein